MRAAPLGENLERQVDNLVEAMRTAVGYRTVWLDDGGTLWHSEPDDEAFDGVGLYVGTFLRPDRELVLGALVSRGRSSLVSVAAPRSDVTMPLAALAAAI